MRIYPAIDLRKGQCVRLMQGDFAQTTIYNNNPQDVAREFAQAGAEWLHVVDLDGAQCGSIQQLSVIKAIADAAAINLQVGGGVRTVKDIKLLLDAGAKRVVIGSVCIKSPQLVQTWIKELGAKYFTIALDFRVNVQGEPMVVTHGWQQASDLTVWQALDALEGIQHVLCTDVQLDGAQQGPNLAFYKEFIRRYPQIELQASGGVGGLNDLEALKAIDVKAVIVGRALYEGSVKLEEALAC